MLLSRRLRQQTQGSGISKISARHKAIAERFDSNLVSLVSHASHESEITELPSDINQSCDGGNVPDVGGSLE